MRLLSNTHAHKSHLSHIRMQEVWLPYAIYVAPRRRANCHGERDRYIFKLLPLKKHPLK